MTFCSEKKRSAMLLAGVGAMFISVGAFAGVEPPSFSMEWDVSNDGIGPNNYNWNQFGQVEYGTWNTPAPQNWSGDMPGIFNSPREGWNYTGSLTNSNWDLDWNCTFTGAADDGVGGGLDGSAFVTANIVVTNNSINTENFTLLMTLPLDAPILSPQRRGSIVGTVTDLTFDDATVSAPAGESIYTGLIDGADERELMADPFSQNAGGPLLSANVGPEDFGIPTPEAASQDADSTIGIFLDFDLSAGDSASFTAIFEITPAPGGMALLAAAGLLGGRRRRRA